MLSYWLLYGLPAMAALQAGRPHYDNYLPVRHVTRRAGWPLAQALITLMIGFRYEVGGDWFNYEYHVYMLTGIPWAEAAAFPDPGFALVLWLSVSLGWGQIGANLICALIFTGGLMAFCRSLPRPWLAVAVAVPYLVIVLGMGYARQGVALGFFMYGLASLRRGSVLRYLVAAILGATFHKTAVLLLAVPVFFRSRYYLWNVLLVGVVLAVGYKILLAEAMDHLQAGYLDAQMQSEGALIRLAMNAVPAIILLWRGRWFGFGPAEAALWRGCAMLSLLLLGLYFVLPSSTVVDRLGLYLLPLQLLVFAYLPNVMAEVRARNPVWVRRIMFYYGAVLFVWLNYATHARYWIPYRFYPFEVLF